MIKDLALGAEWMIVTADIGASKVKVASFERVGDGLELKEVERYLTKDYPDFLAVLNAFLASHPGDVEAVSIGGAGVKEDDKLRFTNISWVLHQRALAQALGLPHVFILNDVEAHGYGLFILDPKDLVVIQPGEPRPGNKAFMAVGTGLGESIIFRAGDSYIPCATEGGHADFGPSEPHLFEFLQKRYPDHVSWERVVSGRFGFRNLFDFLIESGEISANDSLVEKLQGKDQIGPDLQEAAQSGHPGAQRALHLFASLFGAEAGNLALKAMATEGIFIGGGVARRHAQYLTNSDAFVSAFNAKGRMKRLLSKIPVYLVMDRNLAVRGLAHYAVQQIR